MSQYSSKLSLALLAVCSLLVSGCATHGPQGQDLLKNTKQLTVKGHADLYNNGAFHVPRTEIALIPAGPSASELALELVGLKARQSFVQSIKNARDSVYLVADGTKKSYHFAKGIHQSTDEVAQYITDYSRPNSKLLIYKAYPRTKHIVGESWRVAGETANAVGAWGDELANSSLDAGQAISSATDTVSAVTVTGSWRLAKDIARSSTDGAGDKAVYAWDEFVQGYAALPSNLSERVGAVQDSISLADFAKAYDKSQDYRERRSEFYTDIVVDATESYGSDIKRSFKKAGESFDEMSQTGISLATLKAARWVLQGIFWDSLIKPMGAVAVGSVGYLTVNTVTFPIVLVAHSSVPTAEIAVEVTWNTAGSFYDVVAPSAIAATASLFSMAEFVGGNAAAGLTAATGATAGGVTYVAGKASAAAVSAGGYSAGKTVQYIGVPLSAAGVAVAGGATGVVVGGASVIAGGTLVVAGEASAATTQVMGNLLAGGTLAAGTTASVAAGTGLGVFEVAKAVVVPTGYGLGGGVVLGYGTLSQLAAHSILAVGDASYMVLSLEGPRWVLYAVKGELGQGDALAPGTVLDLEKMQSAGEVFSYLPVSDEEMKKVLESIPGDLPQLKTEQLRSQE